MNIYRERFLEFHEIVEGVQADHLDEEIRKDSISAAKSLSKLFELSKMQETWNQRVSQVISDTNILRVRGISPDLRRNFPLSELDSEEVEDLKKRVSEYDVYENLNGLVPNFALKATQSGLQDIAVALEFYELFGSNKILDAVHKSMLDIGAIETILKDEDRSRLSGLKELVGTLYSKIQAANAGVDLAISLGGKWQNLLSLLSGDSS